MKAPEHGWTVPGRDVYDEKQAERHYEKLFGLLKRNLSSWMTCATCFCSCSRLVPRDSAHRRSPCQRPLCQPARRPSVAARRAGLRLCVCGSIVTSVIPSRKLRRLRYLATGDGGGWHGGLAHVADSLRCAHRAGDGKGPGDSKIRRGQSKLVGCRSGRGADAKSCEAEFCRVRADHVDGWISKTRIWGVDPGEVFR